MNNSTSGSGTFLPNATLDRSRSSLENYFAIVVIMIVAFISLTGNVMICILTATRRCLREQKNVLIFSLAFSEILFISGNAPFSVMVLMNNSSMIGATACDLIGLLSLFSISACLWTLTSIAVFRYLHMCWYEFYARYVSFGAYVGTTCFIWVMAATVQILPLTGIGGFSFYYEYAFCGLDSSTHTLSYIPIYIIAGVLPGGAIIYCYFRIIRCVLLVRRRVGRQTTPGDPTRVPWFSRTTRKEVQMTKMSFVLCISFICAWVPMSVEYISKQLGYELGVSYPLWAAICLYIGFALDPFIYAFMKGPYKTQINLLLKHWKTLLCKREVRTNVETIEI